MRQLHIGVFENAQANDTGMALWRHPDHQRVNFDRLEYWTDLAAVCEDAHLDFIFLADAWGWADINGDRPEICTIEGLELPRLDPAAMVAAMFPQTKHLGLVITAATTAEQPYSLARRLSTIDHISGGRLGWNIVTGGTADTAALAFGTPQIKHDDRYDMADDFMDVVYKVWEGTWEPDALIRDKNGMFADPKKVHRIDHDGPFFTSHGWGNAPYSPQGTPVLFQAGSSGRGRRFGATHGECIFISGSTVEKLRGYATAVRQEAAEVGRDPQSVKALAGVTIVVAPTREAAQKKHEEILSYQTPEITVASYAWFTGLDLSSYDRSTPMEDLHTEMSQTQIERFKGQTVGEVLDAWHRHGVRAEAIVGSPEDVADELCMLAEGAELDGFLITPLIQPGATTDFIEHVLPILKKRGAFRDAYEEDTLRERLVGGGPRLPKDHPGAQHRQWI